MMLLKRLIRVLGLITVSLLLMVVLVSVARAAGSADLPMQSRSGGAGVLASATDTIEVRVSQSSDDAEEHVEAPWEGKVQDRGNTLELGLGPVGPQYVGLRFANLDIPKGVRIEQAYIEFTATDPGGNLDPTDLTISGEASDTAATYKEGDASYDISGRPMTATSVDWDSVPVWPEEGGTHQTPDLSAIVQEIVRRAGWAPGNAIAFQITGTAGQRTAVSYDGAKDQSNMALSPKLVVTFAGETACVTLTTNVIPPGAGTVVADPPPNCADGKYYMGETVELTAEPTAKYYAFSNWSDDLTGSTNPDTLTMDANHSVAAHFQYTEVTPIPTDSGLKVAFIGDTGAGAEFGAVLDLIKAEGADMVLHQGDFGYEDGPKKWEQVISDHLGDSYPYFGTVGNHDILRDRWPDYQSILQSHLDKTPGASCDGDLGVQASCTYRGLSFILSGIGTLSSADASYIRDQFRNDAHIWKLCTWHKNQNAMQLGVKGDAVGWEAYENCLDFGAIIATGHEHSYQRTRTLTSTENQKVDLSCEDNPDTPDVDVCVGPGRTFVFVSGAGGKSMRNQDRCLPSTFPYGCKQEWAKVYTTDQDPDAAYGALFITFHVNGDPYQAEGYFKTIEGEIIDQFDVTGPFVPPRSIYLPIGVWHAR